MLLSTLTELVRSTISEVFEITPETVVIEAPPDREFGDLAVNAFLLARDLRKAPPMIAEELAAALKGRGPITDATPVKGYVNLRIDAGAMFASVIPALLRDADAYGSGTGRGGQRVMVEFSAPNTNKPQHLGHLRTNFLGDSISRILANAGAEIVRANLYNDRGIAICKSMVAYRRWGGGRTPEEEGVKGDHYVGGWYVRFERELAAERDAYVAAHPDHWEQWRADHATDRKGRPLSDEVIRKNYLATFRESNFGMLGLGAECQEMLRAWEADDEEVRALWTLMNGWTIAGFESTYERLGITFDQVYRESETYLLGKDIVAAGLEAGVFYERSDGAIEIDLSEWKLGKKVVLRSDGTAVYVTQDLGTTVRKAEEHGLDGQVWVVAEEQKYHFQVLFRILELLGHAWATNLFHLAYGLVHLPEGRMKSREGKVVDADDLLDEVRDLAIKEIRKRDPEGTIDEAEVTRRGTVIGLAALRFMLLKVTPLSSMIFNPEESVKLEGDTGPRVLYAYARLNTMIQEAGADAEGEDAAFDRLDADIEKSLLIHLLDYPRITARAAADYNPSLIASFLLDVTREMNRFYERCDVLREKDPDIRRARLLLCRAVAGVLRHGSGLLGIQLLERM